MCVHSYINKLTRKSIYIIARNYFHSREKEFIVTQMNETLILFKTVALTFKTFIPASNSETFFSYGVKLRRRISFNALHVLKSFYFWF